MAFNTIVDEEKCEGCEECVDVCPVEVFEMQDDKSVAVNAEECLGCESCVEVCETDAIFKDQLENPQNEEIKIKVGTITIAIGADMYRPEGEYCYVDDPEQIHGDVSVITNLGLERLLNPNGPTKGEEPPLTTLLPVRSSS